jgi:hypothetical protein
LWKRKSKNVTDIPPCFNKYFKIKDKIISYGSKKQKQKESRLTEIYRKFSKMLELHKEELKDGFNLGEGKQNFKMIPAQSLQNKEDRKTRKKLRK